MEVYKSSFAHIYKTSGFAISGKFTEDGKDYNPPLRHACASGGILCKKQIREQGIITICEWFICRLVFLKRDILRGIRE